MEERAEVAPEIELTIENWDAQFGDGRVNTPIGEVKMGENQFTKLMRQGREGKLGMIKPTLETPDVIIEDASEAKDGEVAERNSSYVFVKAFKKADGSRYYYFTSITVSKDGREVVVSSQEKRRNRLLRLMTEGKILWRTPKDATTASVEQQGLDYAQPLETETTTKGSGITPQSTDTIPADKVSKNSANEQGKDKKKKDGKILGRRQVEASYPKAIEAFKKAMDAHGKDEKLAEKYFIEALTYYNTVMINVRRGDEGAIHPDELSLLQAFVSEAEKLGYTIHDGFAEGQPYNEGMKVIADFVDDPTLPEGAQIIRTVSEPCVLKDGVKVKAARIVVAQNLPEEAEPPATNRTNQPESEKAKMPAPHKPKYTIERTSYTNKRGKTTPMLLVKFDRELSKEELAAGKELAKESRGWWDREKGGFMMRSEEAAKELAEAIAKGDEETIADAQPLSAADMAAATDAADLQAVDETIQVEQEPQTTPQYDYDREDDVYDKTLTGLRNVLNDRKRGAIPSIKSIENVIRDLRKKAKTIEDGMATAAGETIPQAFDALANLNGKRRAYEQFLNDIRKKMAETERDDALAAHGVKIGDKVMYKGKEATIYDANHGQVTLDVGLSPVLYEVTDWDNVELPSSAKEETPQVETKQDEPKQEQPKQEEQKAKSKWVNEEDADRFEELRARMRQKLRGQMNMGIDPEVFAIGVEMSYLMLKKGARKFAEFAKQMIEAMGDGIRPYIKAFYNGARDLPEMADYEKEMTPYDEVRTFDVMNFDKATVSAVATAEAVVKEREVENQAAEATQKLKEQRNEKRKEESSATMVAEDGTPLRKATQEDLEQAKPVYYKGKRYGIMALVHHGEQAGLQFTKPTIKRVYLTNGKDVVPDELYVEDTSVGAGAGTVTDGKTTIGKKPAKKDRNEDDGLFAGLFDAEEENKPQNTSESGEKTLTLRKDKEVTEKQNDNGLQRPDESRSGRDTRDSDNTGEPTGELRQADRQESGRPYGRGQEERGGTVRQRVLDELRPDDKLEGQPKNTRNNHSERGKDYAPKGVDARIEANIAAIELAQKLIESGRAATSKEMEVLRKFSGWGGLGKAFNENPNGPYGGYNPTPRRLKELLGVEGYSQAEMSRNSAYFTPAKVIDALWDIARAMGFKGGKVLEGSAGIGNILGLMPQDMSARSDIHAVEIDSTTGGILSLLYPDAKVDIQGFEETKVENGSVDLTITNVPFVTGLHVNDKTGDKDLSRKFSDIHDFCIAKNIRKLREGGIGIFITSSGTLDNSKKLRDWIVGEGKADVVGAFRLNNETFGGTGATSDIIVVRKRVNGKKSAHAIDVSSIAKVRTESYETGKEKKIKVNGVYEYLSEVKEVTMTYNRYFVEHPEMMGGEMEFGF